MAGKDFNMELSSSSPGGTKYLQIFQITAILWNEVYNLLGDVEIIWYFVR